MVTINNIPLGEYKSISFHVYKEDANQNLLIKLNKKNKDRETQTDHLMSIRLFREYECTLPECDVLLHINAVQLSSQRVA